MARDAGVQAGWRRFDETGERVGGALFVPETGGNALPLVVALHGCRQDAEDFAAGTRFADLAVREGFAVLFPDSVRSDAALRLNPLGCWVWWAAINQTRGGEPGLIVNLIARARDAEPRIGKARACVTGLSSGAAMATILGAVYPDKVRAVASHAGVAYSTAEVSSPTLPNWFDGVPDPAAALAAFSPLNWYNLGCWATQSVDALEAPKAHDRAEIDDNVDELGDLREAHPETDGKRVRVLIVHGAADDTVDPGHARLLVDQVRAFAAEAYGQDVNADADAEPLVAAPGTGAYPVAEEAYSLADGTPVVRLVMIERLGHAWSGGAPEGTYTDPDGPDATALTWAFFRDVPGS